MKALKKTITYRLLAFIVGGGTTALFLLVSPTLTSGATGIVAGEGVRTGLYWIHEKYWEKEKPKEPEQKSADKDWLKHGVDEFE